MKKLLVILLIICYTQNDLFSQIDWVGTGQMLKTDKKVSIAESTAEADDIASKSKTSIIANSDRFGLFIGNKSNPKELDETFPEGGWCFPNKYPQDVFALYSASPTGYAGYFDGKLGICGAQINFFEPFSDGIVNDVEWRLLASSEEFKIMSGNTSGRFLLKKEIGHQLAFARILVDDKDMKVAMEVTFDEWGENEQLFQLRTDGKAYFPGKVIVGLDSGVSPMPSTNFLVEGNSAFTGIINANRIDVSGKLWSKSIEVKLPPFPDYVFEDEYDLMSLSDLQKYIKKNGHLPNIPSAEEVEAKGSMDIGQFQTMQLEKIEELTLYILQLNEKIEKMEEELESCKSK